MGTCGLSVSFGRLKRNPHEPLSSNKAVSFFQPPTPPFPPPFPPTLPPPLFPPRQKKRLRSSCWFPLPSKTKHQTRKRHTYGPHVLLPGPLGAGGFAGGAGSEGRLAAETAAGGAGGPGVVLSISRTGKLHEKPYFWNRMIIGKVEFGSHTIPQTNDQTGKLHATHFLSMKNESNSE